MRILLLSGYNAASHQYWHQGLVEQFPEHQWTVLTLPDRHFSWRLRGNSLTWAMGPEREILERPWDRVIATSMVDLSSLRGMVPSLAQVPTLVYFHENQFAYPRSKHQTFSPVEPQLQSIYTALCGERLIFNTEYNRQTFLQGARQLLKKLPDHVPKGVIEELERRSNVIPVPLASDVPTTIKERQPDTFTLCWAARWEYDKGPVRLLNIVQQLEDGGADYQLCLLGQTFRKQPQEFDQIRDILGQRIVHFGYAESRQAYLQWLCHADAFLSTSYHEFQGISVIEAVACGAVPVLPDEQSYPYLFDREFLYDSEADAVQKIRHLIDEKQKGNRSTPSADHFRWSHNRKAYKEAIDNRH